MFFGGGFPFGDVGGGMPRGPAEPVDNESFYRLLGIDKKASAEEVRKAFKKLAIKHHPDKGGDQEKFKEICRAYEILSDAEKRQVYDQYGEKGLEGQGGSDPSDIFDMFFGGGGRRSRGPQKGEDVVSAVEFTLEQFYKGCTKKMSVTRSALCAGCGGKGGQPEDFSDCADCNGRGVRILTRRMGPMITQSQQPCGACRATGRYIPEHKMCKDCGGGGTRREKKILECTLPAGAPENHKIVFQGQADEQPDVVTGDVVFVCKCKPHAEFKRVKNDLVMEKTISLSDALCGIAFNLTHLDGKVLCIKTPSNMIIKPSELLAVEYAGMPNRYGANGNLYIKFTLEFPETLQPAAKEALLKVLPSPYSIGKVASKAARNEEDDGVRVLKRIDPAEARRGQSDDDDDQESGPQGVQCRQA